jgi:hypothetical protein
MRKRHATCCDVDARRHFAFRESRRTPGDRATRFIQIQTDGDFGMNKVAFRTTAAMFVGTLSIAIHPGCSEAGRAGNAERVETASSALTQATYYVSPSGTGGRCAITVPCSLTTVQALVRNHTAGMTGDIDVRLLSGTYRLTAPFALDGSAGDGATNGFHVIYEAAPGAHPVLDGGIVISGWQPLGIQNGAWVADVPSGFTTRQVYINGVRATRAQGTIAAGSLTQTTTGYVSTSSVLNGLDDPDHAELVYDHDQRENTGDTSVSFFEARCGIASTTASDPGSMITMNQPCFDNSTLRTFALNIGLPDRVENDYSLLDQPGEWYIQPSLNEIFYIPRAGENMNTALVEAPSLQTLLSGTGTAAAPLTNVIVRGLTFSYGGWLGPDAPDGFSDVQATYHITGTNAWPQAEGGCDYTNPPGTCPYGAFTQTPSNVSFDNAQGLTLERNTFAHLGAGGLFIGPSTSNTTVNANVFDDISGNGLAIGDVQDNDPADPSVLPTNTTVTNNWVTEVGEDYKGAVGIFQGYARNSLIQHNQINDVPYSGISVGWNWGRSSSPATGNVVRANLIFNHMQYLTDGGGIYMNGAQGPDHTTGLLADYNVIHAQEGPGYAIYTDGGSEHVTLDHNVAYDNNADGDVDWGGCTNASFPGGPNTGYGDFVATNNYGPTPSFAFPCGGPDLGLPVDPTVTNSTTIAGPNDVPSAIVRTAGIEAAYEDIRGDTASRYNLAYRKPTMALYMDGTTALMQPGLEPGAAVDGDATTYAQATNQYRWQLQVDLLDVQVIDSIRVTMPAVAYATSLHVDASTDGTTYATIAQSTTAGPGTTVFAVSPLGARYLRVIADEPDGPNQTGGQMAISELQIFGPPDLALNKPTSAQYLDGSAATMQFNPNAPTLNPDEATDGIGSTYAQAWGQFRWMLTADLLSPFMVRAFLVTMPSFAYATAFHIDESLDNQSWTTVYSNSATTAGTTYSLSLGGALARYVRIVADEPNGVNQTGGQMAISRFSVYSADSDVGPLTPVTAQYIDGSPATMQSFGPVGNAADGNPVTYAQAWGQFLWQLVADMGSIKQVNEVRVLMPATTFATQFHLDFSTDGASYTQGAAVSAVGVGGEVAVAVPSRPAARYVRVVADLPNGVNQRGGQMGISELTVLSAE